VKRGEPEKMDVYEKVRGLKGLNGNFRRKHVLIFLIRMCDTMSGER